MIAVIDHQPFTFGFFRRDSIQHPRLYLKDETYYRRSPLALTRLGLTGSAVVLATILTIISVVIF